MWHEFNDIRHGILLELGRGLCVGRHANTQLKNGGHMRGMKEILQKGHSILF